MKEALYKLLILLSFLSVWAFIAVQPVSAQSIFGTVYEDLNGDANLGDAVGRGGVDVSLYLDGGDGSADGGDDSLVATTSTDGSGNYTFVGLGSDTYWVVVDSKTLSPSNPFNGGDDQRDVWAEQTYGPAGALCADGSGGTTEHGSVGACYGGRLGGVSDNASALASAQHIAKVVISGADATAIDFGFSFQVVTNVRGGDNGDDDGSAARTIQGSLRQFLQNGNAINGANVMRLVPAVAANGSGGGGQWWRLSVSVDLPDVLDSNTTIDGTAYSLSNGTTLRDDNPGSLGTGGVVGVDGWALPALGRPEFEIVDINNKNIGLDLQANNSTVRRLAIYGFGDAQGKDGEANIRVGEVSGTLIEECVVGASASSFTSTGEVDTGDNIRVSKGDSGTIRNNLIGFSGGSGIGFKGSANGWTIEGNEIRGNALEKTEMNGISLETSAGATIRGNLIVDNEGAGVDTKDSTGSNTIENNTISANGIGTVETPGIRLYGTGSTIDRNVISENYGAGVMVTKDATQNTISQNSIYDNGTASNQIGIDLLEGGDDDKTGAAPFVTLNDPGDTDDDANGLLNFPVLETADISGSNLTIIGFGRPGSVIEFFIAEPDPSGFGEGKTYLLTLTEGSAADLDATTGSYGPGPINNLNQGSDTTNRFRFQLSVPPGVSIGTWLTATATLGGATSEFSGNAAVGPQSISGTVYEDLNGDANLGDAVGRGGVDVSLYLDGGDGSADGGDDSLVATTSTDGSGNYTFVGLGSDTYWVVVDSKTLSPSNPFNGGDDQRDVWAEQTYGPAGALCADGSGGTTEHGSVGACYGGRLGGVSDNASALASAQHIAKVVISGADATAIDFGFSFQVVTNVRGGDNGDDDGSAARTIQGSLRQFLQNGNAINGANVMRLVPAVAANGSGGGGQWWRLSVSVDLPDVLDSNTTIDGTAYSLSNGTTLRDDNPGSLGTGGVVGVDGWALPALGRPEFEIVDINNKNIGLDLQANNSTVRRLAIYGFGDAQGKDGEANIRVGEVSGTLIEECVVGASASSFTSTGEVDTGDNIRVSKGDSGTIRNNLIGFSGGSGIGFKGSANGWTIEGNEIRGNALEKTEMNGISLETSAGATIRGNLIVDNEGAGVDTKDSTGSNTIENNTISANGIGTVETPGIRLYGTGSTIDRNVISENYGAGVMVTKDATQNTISQNSIYDNGTASNQIGIDLLEGGDDDKTGAAPFVTLNDPGDTDDDANGLLNFPVLETADISGSNLTIIGFGRPGSVIEFFIAEPDPSGFGEGKTYLLTLTEGSAADLDATTGSYGPGPVNGISQGEDTTNRFQFEVSVPPGVNNGTQLTATATLGSSTSEFSGNVTVTGFLLPNITLVKSASAPAANPADVLTYTVIVLNSGAAEATNVVVDDKLSPYVAWSLDSFGAGVPFEFIDGSSGLTIGTPVYSNNNGIDFTYTPVSEGGGAPAGYDGNVTNWKIPMTGTMNASGQFTLRYKVMVK